MDELEACNVFIAYREEQRLVQFFIALRSDFEKLNGSILHILHFLLLTQLSGSY